jgi:uncharacterized protein YjbJ (UPF0337 family)
MMNKDQVKGAMDDAAGRIKRQAGEWTGNPNAQVEGAGQQVKGKAEKAWGNVKDAAQKEADERREHEKERERNAAGAPHQERSHHG